MNRRFGWPALLLAVAAAATLAVTGCSILVSVAKSNLSRRRIPECATGNHDECCRNCLGEDYVCTGTQSLREHLLPPTGKASKTPSRITIYQLEGTPRPLGRQRESGD